MAVVGKEKISPVHVVASVRKENVSANDEISCSFSYRDLAVDIGSQYCQPLTALAAAALFFRHLEKLVSPTQAHRRLSCFFFRF